MTATDLASRRLASWAIADHMRADLVTDALAAAALHPRQPRRVDHAHRPRSPYTSRIFAEACRSAGARQSMSAVGFRANNALAESNYAESCTHTLLDVRHRWSQ
ncbi:transposase family protein [Streptomyces sp. RM72]|nr:transposase family protein [Streptomyces sp. RM72]